MPDIKRAPLALTTSAGTAYTCPAETTATIRSIHIANKDGTNSVDVDVWWTDAGDSDAAVYLCKGAEIVAGDALEISGTFHLNAGDTLKALASAADDADLTAAYIEEPVIET